MWEAMWMPIPLISTRFCLGFIGYESLLTMIWKIANQIYSFDKSELEESAIF